MTGAQANTDHHHTVPELRPSNTVSIQNVVASSSVDQELSLRQLSADLPDAIYDPNRFPGVVYRSRSPRATTLIYRTGAVIIIGGNSVEAIETVFDRHLTDLRELGIRVPESPTIEIENIVSLSDLGCPLNLPAISIGLGLEATEYEPEQFPGLIYRIDDPPVVTLLFGSGKVVISGGKTTEQAVVAVENISSRLLELGLMTRTD